MDGVEFSVIDDTANEDIENGVFGWIVATSDEVDDDEDSRVIARFKTEIMAEWFCKTANSMEGVPHNAE